MGADWNGERGNLTTVGSAGALSESYFGTADQAGNVWEWTDAVIDGSSLVLRGGWFNSDADDVKSSHSAASWGYPWAEVKQLGFRVASVPEPTSIVLTMLASGVMLIRCKR